MQIISPLPKIIGYTEIPQSKSHNNQAPLPEGRKRHDRKPFDLNPERSKLVHQVVTSLQPGSALKIECPSAEEMQTFRCHLLSLQKGQVKTHKRGDTLLMYLKPAAQQLEMEL
jgi:hypothetical protein